MKRFFKTCAAFLAASFVLSMVPMQRIDAASIDIYKFADSTLRKYISENYDKNKDGYLSDTEIKAATVIDLPNKGVRNLAGVENLKYLTYIDVSGSTQTYGSYSAYYGVVDFVNFTQLETVKLGTCEDGWNLNVQGCEKLRYISSPSSVVYGGHAGPYDVKTAGYISAIFWGEENHNSTVSVTYEGPNKVYRYTNPATGRVEIEVPHSKYGMTDFRKTNLPTDLPGLTSTFTGTPAVTPVTTNTPTTTTRPTTSPVTNTPTASPVTNTPTASPVTTTPKPTTTTPTPNPTVATKSLEITSTAWGDTGGQIDISGSNISSNAGEIVVMIYFPNDSFEPSSWISGLSYVKSGSTLTLTFPSSVLAQKITVQYSGANLGANLGVASATLNGVDIDLKLTGNVTKVTPTPSPTPTNTPTSRPTVTTTPVPTNSPADIPVVIPVASISAEQRRVAVNEFVTRLYEEALGRSPEQSGLQFWTDNLNNGGSASQVAYSFIFSNEVIARDLTNEAFVGLLYRAMYGREASASELSYWTDLLGRSNNRDNLFSIFADSYEWISCCYYMGINSGSDRAPVIDGVTDNLTAYINSVYQIALGRAATRLEINNWLIEVVNHRGSNASMLGSLLLSSEYISLNKTDDEYVRDLFLLYQGVDPNYSAIAAETSSIMIGETREMLMDSHARCEEFRNTCALLDINV